MRFINKPVQNEQSKQPFVVQKKWQSLDYRIAVCKGSNGYYTFTVSTKELADIIEKSSEFVRWGTEWSFVNVCE